MQGMGCLVGIIIERNDRVFRIKMIASRSVNFYVLV